MTWVETVPTAALLLVVLVVPGWVYVHALGVRGLVALAAAPAATAGVLGVLTVALGAVGLAWSLPVVVTALVLVGVVLTVGGRILLRGSRASGRPRLGPGPAGLVAAGVAAGTALVTVAFADAVVTPDAVPQMHDSLFHLNGAELVTRTGDASPLGSMQGLYGQGRGGGFYPTLWHALVALGASVSGVVPATNVLIVVGVVLPWMLGVAALAHVAAPRHPLVASLAPVVAASSVVFPTVAVMFKGMYPFGLGVALTPATLALAAAVLPQLHRGGWTAVEARRRGRLGPWLALALAAGGVVLAHSSGLAALGFLGAPLVVVACWRAGRQRRRAGQQLLGWVLALAPVVVLGLLVAAVFTVPKLQAMAGFSSPEGSRVDALLHVLLGSTPQETAGNLAVALLVLVGLVTAWLNARWLAWAWLVALLLFVAASGPDGALRTLTGFWYKSPDRLESLLVTVSAVLGAWGAVAVGRAVLVAVPNRRTGDRGPVGAGVLAGAVAVVVVLVAALSSGTFSAQERAGTTASAYRPEEMVHPPWATQDELDFIRELDDVLPEDAVVVGDPMNGASLVQALTDSRAYLPILGESALSTDQRYLQENFHDIGSDPRVCEILRDGGVEYFYRDESVPYGRRSLADMRPGLYDVDVTSGFELLASSGSAEVYRIVACG
ncbi:DUF6541 family protein [Georgenia sp. H159]|uniref:DUF6541 family protein n=1 Tax=Georgenia sp. H159 TaxID=3076115 RepID=UPI002D76DC10|nr:DUF6541 family protein [Georgenia sp. H159]